METFVPYLTTNDYLSVIQKNQLVNQVLNELENEGSAQRRFAEAWAIGKIKGKLSAAYDLDFEITATLPFDPLKRYYAGNRCTIDFPLWVQGTEYTQNQSCVIKNGKGYMCNTTNTDLAFDAVKWTAIGNQYDIYYIKHPHPIFMLEVQESKGTYTAGYYEKDDKVWWNNKIYTARVETIILDDAAIIQFINTADIPAPNTFPNDKRRGKDFWTEDSDFYYEGEPPFYNSDIWTLGDNRDPVLMKSLMDLSIWMLHNRIAPNNIPQLRNDNKDAAFGWINEVNKGTIIVNIMPLQPTQGTNFSGGSAPKYINKY